MSTTAKTPVRVAVAGATGHTGNAVVWGLMEQPGVDVVACIAPSLAAAGAAGSRSIPPGTETFGSCRDVDIDVDVLIDFTIADVAQGNCNEAIRRGWHIVLGTTGIGAEQLDVLGAEATAAGLGMIYAPNFAIGAVLMMEFAQRAAAYFPTCEIIETHGEHKLDAPSGTAHRTAELITAASTGSSRAHAHAQGTDSARGDMVGTVPVHSLRLPGAVAHQDIIFASGTERLLIHHDALNRSCYAHGVALAARWVRTHHGLTIGLENAL